MTDYIPSSDGAFDFWRTTFDKFLKDNLAALGLVAGDITQFNSLQAAWEAALSDFLNKKALADAALVAKDTSREQLIDTIRSLVRQLQSNPATTDEQRAGLGITVPDTKPTRVSIPTTAPFGQVDTSTRWQHMIQFRNSQTPNSKAKPQGVHGCQIWVYIGSTPPTSPDQFSFIATDTRTPYLLVFDAEDAGKNAYYILRWVNSRDEPGPWSETIVATITG
jgi:hypothetical protein